MSEGWKQWEGYVVDRKYQLQLFLGSTDHSAVFLAGFRDPEPRQAAVKFISADLPNAGQQLAAWNTAAHLNHRNLLRIYGTGRCSFEDMELLYVAMEYAEENLGQVLPQRALIDEEAHEMLHGVVDVLVYLHGKNLTHGHIKPSNVLAIGELLKLSSDTILPSGEVREMRRERSAYDAPEVPASPSTPAADMWSLGVSLVEALTQQPAVLPFYEQADPVIPPAVHEPFLEIAKCVLRREPRLRWSCAKVAERLNPAATAVKAAAAGAGASPNVSASPKVSEGATARAGTIASASIAAAPPVAAAPAPPPAWASSLNVPLSKEPAVPLAKQPPAPAGERKVTRPVVRTAPTVEQRSITLPHYVVPLFAGVLVLAGIIALPKILRQREVSVATAGSAAVSAGSTNALPGQSSPPASRVMPPATQSALAKPAPSDVAKSAAPEHPAATPPQPLAAPPATAAPAVLRSNEAESVLTPKTSGASLGHGEVLDQVLPEISPKALATIHGTVRINVKARVDEAGNVTEATLDTPDSSKYFADRTLKAARRWVFSSPEANGRGVPSDWLIQFFLTQDGVRAAAQQLAVE
ncbi:MAG: protein kinase [Candidatus Acidiferrum sp.]